MTTAATVRVATSRDVESIAVLLAELGYPAPAASVALRLDRVLGSRATAFIAEVDGIPTGLCTAHLFDVIHEDATLAMLSALVVSASARRRGVGRQLVEAAETWARASGSSRIVVATNLARTGAHAFYEALGYEHSSRRYVKRIA